MTVIRNLNDSAVNQLAENDNRTLHKLAARLCVDIDNYAVKTYDDGHRTHLGASVIGSDCFRYSWMVFRWVKAEKFEGRMLRLFQRGHREENTFVEYLEGIGAKVTQFDPSIDPSLPKHKRQIRISSSNGHFGGSIDGLVQLPPEYGIDETMLVEFKTQAANAKFRELLKSGVRIANYKHFSQMNVYMHALNLRHALYMNVNKNDDTLYVEIVEREEGLGESLINVADNIITSNEPPEKYRSSPAMIPCAYCNFREVCHKGELPEKNCRSCKLAVAGANKTWICTKWNAVIPPEHIATGCDGWVPIINGD